MEHVIFDRQLYRPCRAVFFRGTGIPETESIVAEFLLLPATLSELLLSHDGVCISIYGENCLIPVLFKAFGVDGTIELLRQRAITFHLQTEAVTYIESELPGVMPLAPGKHSSGVHADPEASVDSMLQALTTPPSGALLKTARTALIDAYVAPSQEYARNAVKLAQDGYARGRFRDLGLPPQRPIGELKKDERALLGRLASELHHFALIADLKLGTLDEFAITRVCDDSLRNLASARRIASAAVAVFDIENVPQVAQLFAAGALRTVDVPNLRQHPDVVRFRNWLSSVAVEADAADVARRYLDAVTRRNAFFEKAAGKLFRTISVSGMSAMAGAVLAGPAGATVGAAAGAVLDKALDLGIDLLDEFLLDGVLKGWQPRNYFDRVIRPAFDAVAPKSQDG
jgi:hypothetical protein